MSDYSAEASHLNPLYISSGQSKKAGLGSTILPSAPSKGREWKLSYKLELCLFVFTYACSCLALVYVNQQAGGKWVDHHRLGFISLALAFSILSTEVFRNFKKTVGNLKKGNRVIRNLFVFYFFVFLVLAIDPTLNVSPEGNIKSSTNVDLKTKSCIVIEKRGWRSTCIQNIMTNGRPFVAIDGLVKENISAADRIETLEGIDLFYSKVMAEIVNPLVSGSFSKECFAAVTSSLCMELFQTCDQFCDPLSQCPSKCSSYDAKCKTAEEKEAVKTLEEQLRDLKNLDSNYVSFVRNTVEWEKRKETNYKMLGTFETFFSNLAGQLHAEIETLHMGNCISGGYPCWYVNGSKSEFKHQSDHQGHQGRCDPGDLEQSSKTGDRDDTITLPVMSGTSTFWVGLAFVTLSFLINSYYVLRQNIKVLLVERSFKWKKQGSIEKYTVKLSNAQRAVLVWCGLWSGLVSSSVLYYCISKEKIASKKADEYIGERMMVYWWLYFLYTVFVLTSMGSVRQFASAVRGVSHAKKKKKRRKKTIMCLQLYKSYQNLFSLSRGRFAFVKIAATEAWEVLLQFLGFATMCQTSHVSYTIVALGLLFLNITISPLLILNHDRIDIWASEQWRNRFSLASFDQLVNDNGDKWGRIAVSGFDSLIDLGFLFNNILGMTLWNVDEEYVNVEWEVNMSIIWPAMSIGLRMRSIKRALIRTVSRLERTRSELKLKTGVSRRFGMSANTLEQIQRKLEMAKRVAVTIVVLMGTVGIGTITYNLVGVSYNCSREMTPVLWDKAQPKKMFQKGIWELPSCGYGSIKTIVVPPHSNVQEIPEIIGECKNLAQLELPYNGIKSLPKGLLKLQKVSLLNLEGNPAGKKLYIDDIEIYSIHSKTPRDHEFPTKIMCDHLKDSLVEISAKANRIKHVNKCIKNFKRLRLLNLENNLLGSTALPNEFFHLGDGVRYFFGGNPIAHNVSFANWNICSKTNSPVSCKNENKKLEKIVAFIKSNFHQSMEHIDLSGNMVVNGLVVRDVLDNCTRLKRLDVSNNQIASMLGVPGEWDRGDLYKANMWNRLEEIKMDGNPVTVVDLSLAQYFEIRPNLLIHMMGWKIQNILWGRRHLTVMPFRVLEKSSETINMIDLRHKIDGTILNAGSRLSPKYFCKFKNLQIFMVHRKLLGDRPMTSVPNCLEKLVTLLVQDYSLNKIQQQSFQLDNYTWPSFFWNYYDLRVTLSRWGGKGLYDIPPPVGFSNATRIELKYLVYRSPINRFKFDLFPRLRTLKLYRSNLAGPVPSWRSDILQTMDLRVNALSGTVPAGLFSNPNLKVLDLSDNPGINGTLPMANLSAIECLHLHGTSIAGNVPRKYFEDISGLLSLPNSYTNMSSLSSEEPEECSSDKSVCTYANMECQVKKLRDETTAVLCVKKNGNHAACGSFDVNGTWKIG